MVQALKALGRKHVDRKVIEGIRRQLESKACERILRDTRSVTGWIYETLKRIAGVVTDGASGGAPGTRRRNKCVSSNM